MIERLCSRAEKVVTCHMNSVLVSEFVVFAGVDCARRTAVLWRAVGVVKSRKSR